MKYKKSEISNITNSDKNHNICKYNYKIDVAERICPLYEQGEGNNE
jgi:hypothetical protein